MLSILSDWIDYSTDFIISLADFLVTPHVFIIVCLFILVYIAGLLKKFFL